MPIFTLLPNARTALAGRAQAPPDGVARKRLDLEVHLVADGARVPGGASVLQTIELLGAGDVLTVSPAAIARVEPAPGATGVEPNYFPYVEFVDADFPWRYSPDVGTSARIRPWLTLLAVAPGEFRHLERGTSPSARIEVANPALSLPPPEQAWAWAHVHVDRTTQPTSDVTLLLERHPETSFARLLCTRRLADNTTYELFLAPLFESGRLRGLGSEETATPWDRAAWSREQNEPIVLPVYAHWRFTTSAADDFEALIRRLGRTAPAASSAVLATRTIFSGAPGYYTDYASPADAFEAEGAVGTPGAPSPAPIQSSDLTPRLVATLTAVLAGETIQSDGPDEEDPLVALPVYGAHFARSPAVGIDAPGDPWLSEVNLDLRYRLAAGAGARVVRRHQELFMQRAWAQVGQVREANRLRAQLQVTERLTRRYVEKHLKPLDAGVALSLAEPFLGLTEGTDRVRTVLAELTANGVPAGYVGRQLRRVASKRTVRPPGAVGGKAPARRPPIPVIPGTAGPLGVARSVRPAAGDPRKRDRTAAIWRHEAFGGFAPTESVEREAPASAFRAPLFEVAPTDTTKLKEHVLRRILEIPGRRGRHGLQGFREGESESLEPILRGPRLPDAMATFLAAHDPDALIPQVGSLAYNSVTLLEENPRFIEAFLVGCNHEIHRELRWREFPTDLRATVFGRFWSTGAPPESADQDDIDPIDAWQQGLGGNQRDGRPRRLVLVVRGDLVRRFDGFQIMLNRQAIPSGGTWDAGRGTTVEPEFSGSLGGDARYFGFPLGIEEIRQHLAEYFFALFEPLGRHRFGLDIATHEVRTTRSSLARAPMPFPLAGMDVERRGLARPRSAAAWSQPAAGTPPTALSWNDLSWTHLDLLASGYIDFDQTLSVVSGDTGQWGPNRNAATLASVTMQKPVCAVLSAARLVPDV